jgi:hypothetical protein
MASAQENQPDWGVAGNTQIQFWETCMIWELKSLEQSWIEQ